MWAGSLDADDAEDIRPMKGVNDHIEGTNKGGESLQENKHKENDRPKSLRPGGSSRQGALLQNQAEPDLIAAPSKQAVIRCKFHNGVLLNKASRKSPTSCLFSADEHVSSMCETC